MAYSTGPWHTGWAYGIQHGPMAYRVGLWRTARGPMAYSMDLRHAGWADGFHSVGSTAETVVLTVMCGGYPTQLRPTCCWVITRGYNRDMYQVHWSRYLPAAQVVSAPWHNCRADGARSAHVARMALAATGLPGLTLYSSLLWPRACCGQYAPCFLPTRAQGLFLLVLMLGLFFEVWTQAPRQWPRPRGNGWRGDEKVGGGGSPMERAVVWQSMQRANSKTTFTIDCGNEYRARRPQQTVTDKVNGPAEMFRGLRGALFFDMAMLPAMKVN